MSMNRVDYKSLIYISNISWNKSILMWIHLSGGVEVKVWASCLPSIEKYKKNLVKELWDQIAKDYLRCLGEMEVIITILPYMNSNSFAHLNSGIHYNFKHHITTNETT